MNAIRCPNCKATNQMSAAQCFQCGMSFSNLPTTAYVSLPVEQTYQAQAMGFSPPILPQDNEIGRKTFMWYRIYCGFLCFIYLLLTAAGIFLAVAQPATREQTPEESLIIGIVYAVLGIIFFLIFVIALFLPRKPYNWIVGIVLIALGMTSCCFLPFLVPLLIYWIKPETQAFFGRK